MEITKTTTKLADGRELMYFDTVPADRDAPDLRPLEPTDVSSQVRYDPLLREWVIIASHRQSRTFMPPADQCPLDPSAPGRLTEIPAADYEVVVFENRFPSLSPHPEVVPVDGLLPRAPGTGRCEVVCFSPRHDHSFADLTRRQAALVVAAWIDRTTELSAMPGVRQVFCFENRGPEIGVTLSHPHGQIYAYPFVTPRTRRMLDAAADHAARTGGANLFDDLLAAERAAGERVVVAGEHWTAFVPAAAHWPYELHLYPNRRVPRLGDLTEDERAEFCDLYLDVLRRFDRLFDVSAPYISALHQAPVPTADDDTSGFAFHVEIFTIRRAPDKLKYLAGSESGMDAYTNDILPETAAARLRELGVPASLLP
jgi:UDPglucose--hexose-1-phosphate uridylyltransferase